MDGVEPPARRLREKQKWKDCYPVDPTRIGRPDVPPCSDAIDESMLDGTPDQLKSDLVELLGEDLVRHRITDLVRYASDASPYRYVPQVVVQPRNMDHVASIFAYCVRHGRHATFRAGGTSLNGQSQGDDILIDVRQHWSGWAVEDSGMRIRCNVGTTLLRINEVLKPYARRMGPDPASLNAATIGGVLANNAGGMRCTPAIDSYHSIVGMKIVLTTGTIIDTEDPHAEEYFARTEPRMAAGLMRIREQIVADSALCDRIVRKYTIRNTNGYAMHAFLDGKTPVEILRRLMVGSEGTLGFVAEATFTTYKAGVFEGQCAQFCGTQHAKMLLRVYVDTPEQFQQWIAHQQKDAEPSQTSTAFPDGGGVTKQEQPHPRQVSSPSRMSDAATGRRFFEQQACMNCHAVKGTVANGRFGPDLTHLMSRSTIASGIVPNTPDLLLAWITNPNDIKPGALMPAMHLTDFENRQITAYLTTLH